MNGTSIKTAPASHSWSARIAGGGSSPPESSAEKAFTSAPRQSRIASGAASQFRGILPAIANAAAAGAGAVERVPSAITQIRLMMVT